MGVESLLQYAGDDAGEAPLDHPTGIVDEHLRAVCLIA